jgi:Ca2+-transporting ATPase
MGLDQVSSSREWHTLPPGEVASTLQTSLEDGLSAVDAKNRLRRLGSNELVARRHFSTLKLVVEQFRSLVTVLLIAAVAIALYLGESLDAIAVGAVILLSAILGFGTEYRAEKSMEALKKLGAPVSTVIRDGLTQQVPASELVPGDLILLEAGARVPADCRILQSADLRLDESSLTGESTEVEKESLESLPGNAPIHDRTNMAYSGTVVVRGSGRAVVIATGMTTEIGKIVELVETTSKESTPLERKLEQLARYLTLACAFVVPLVVIAGVLRGTPVGATLELGISLAVAAVPEGLPVIATVSLAIGMRRMAKRKAIMKELHAVESLGSVTTICTDKTGTLTKNELTLREISVHNRLLHVTGEGYGDQDEFVSNGTKISATTDHVLHSLLMAGVLCNDASLQQTTETGDWNVIGDSTDAALLTAALKAGIRKDEAESAHPRLAVLPFDPARKYMATLHNGPTGRILLVKGAPGVVVRLCSREETREGPVPWDRSQMNLAIGVNLEMASKALRVLAIAYSDKVTTGAELSESDVKDLVFLGLVGMMDPPRPEAKQSILTCNRAGIRTIMVTGDQLQTALAVARELGLAQGESETIDCSKAGADCRDRVVREDLQKRISVYARVLPGQKLGIVEGLQQRGEIVAMTGDGVNDAPALKKADIGVAMGKKGTDVAKEASDMIITDDNFATIVAAVEEGRVIFDNIRKFIRYLFSCNLSEILVVFIASLVGLPPPLFPLQILWLNLLTDVFPAMALVMEKAEPDVMRRPPRDPKEPLFSKNLRKLVVTEGLILTLATLAVYVWALMTYGPGPQSTTLAFVALAATQVAQALNCRSEEHSVIELGLFSNRYGLAATAMVMFSLLLAVYASPLQLVLKTTGLAGVDWFVIIVASISPVAFVEGFKYLKTHASSHRRPLSQGWTMLRVLSRR